MALIKRLPTDHRPWAEDWTTEAPGAAHTGSTTSRLAKECVAISRQVLKRIKDHSDVSQATYRAYEKSHSSLALWDAGHGVSKGKLDELLAQSRTVRRSVLEPLVSISAILTRKLIPFVHSESKKTISRQTLEDITAEAKASLHIDFDDSSDSEESESNSPISNEQARDWDEILEDLGTDVECLLVLDPIIRCPAPDIRRRRGNRGKEKVAVDWEPHLSYRDKITSISPSAAANWQRFPKTKVACQENTAAEDEQVTGAAVAATAAGAQPEHALAEPVSSKFRDSGISTSIGAGSVHADTVMPYQAQGSESVRIPPLPEDAKQGKPFDCVICGRELKISNDSAWKRHLHLDLCPWICHDVGREYGNKPTAMAPAPCDLVLDAKLETEFFDSYIRHTRYTRGFSARERRIRVREVWDIGSNLGRGSFGSVRVETCRQSPPAFNRGGELRRRVVKVISKAIPNQGRWNYLKEVEAIIKFSHERYAPYFVRTDGWFEDANNVFITLEYFPLGDLQGFMRRLPPFSEDATRQITRQLLDGIALMHDSGFMHRDLKPGNILVEANSPEWLVKITEFGVSERAQEGGTNLRTTPIGTFGYMAPEVLGFLSGNDPAVAYSVTDIWAIGIIAYELLFKRHPFPNVKDMLYYVNDARQLDMQSGSDSERVTESCQDFVKSLLSPNPVTRPTAGMASNHGWIGMGTGTPMNPDEESLFVRDQTPEPQTQLPVAAIPASLARTTSQLNGSGTSTTQSTGTILSTCQGHQLDAEILIPAFRHINLEKTKYFVLRSDNALDIETSAAHGIWTSSQRVNKILNKAYAKTGGQVVLFFSVIKSRKFCGVAQMTSEVDWLNTDPHWLEDVWQGRFLLNWLCLNEVSFDLVKHVPINPTTLGFRAIACYDGTEIAASSAFELMRAFAAQPGAQ